MNRRALLSRLPLLAALPWVASKLLTPPAEPYAAYPELVAAIRRLERTTLPALRELQAVLDRIPVLTP